MRLFSFKKVPCIVWCLALNALIFLGWYVGTPTFSHSYNSPKDVYRMEFHQASILQRIVHYDFRMPYVVRLYRVWPKTLLGESKVVDLEPGGEIHWWLSPPNHAVHVGNDVVFENIPPECTDASLPPACAARP